MPLIATSTIISRVCQMHQALNDIQDLTQWVADVEELLVEWVQMLDLKEDMSRLEDVLNGENFYYEGNLDS